MCSRCTPFGHSLVIFGGVLSVTYLYIFNRVTRQSLHDLAVGTFVVNADAERQHTGAAWRPHFIVVGTLFLVSAFIPVFTSSLAQTEPFKGLLSAQPEQDHKADIAGVIIARAINIKRHLSQQSADRD